MRDAGGHSGVVLRYRTYAALIEAVNRYAVSNGFVPILPSTAAPRAEFAETPAFPLQGDWGVLPQSHSFHKQIAARHLGRVYCVGPAYRLADEDQLHSAVFHQIEFEVADASFDEVRVLAIELIEAILKAVVQEVELEVGWTLSEVDELDLRQVEDPPDYHQYDRWVEGVARRLKQPLWVLNTPQTPPPLLNRTEEGRSRGFDLITPLPSGEILSGGEREPGEAWRFFGAPEPRDGAGETPTSSGFGIGLERLVMALTGEAEIGAARYPCGGPWGSSA